MRKILSLSFLIFTLCLGSSVFGAKTWSQEEFEKLICSMGYGEIDLESLNWVDNYGRLTNFKSNLTNGYSLLILKGNNSSLDGFDENKFNVIFFNTYYTPSFEISGSQYRLYSSIPGFYPPFEFDLNTNTVRYANSFTYYDYNPYIWNQENHNVSQEEWESTSFKSYLFEEACLFCDFTISNINYIPNGGGITNSTVNSYPGVNFKGSITYYPTTETASINYSSGFDSSIEYDLFLEQYKLSDSYNNGISTYPIDTIDLGKVTTSNKEMVISANKFMDSAHYVYRICVGVNNFGSSGKNEIILSTDWLLANDNTIRMYPDFARSHYFTFLSLVDYNPDYSEPQPEDKPSGDTGESGDTVVDTYIPPASGRVPYFVKAPQSYLYNTRYALCNIFLPNDWSFEDIYLLVNKYDSEDNILSRSIIENYNNSSGDNVIFTKLDSGFWSCNLADWYEFDIESDVWYTLSLYSYENGLLDSSRAFYFNLDMTPDNPKLDSDDLLNYDNTDFNDLINSSKSWVTNIFGFLNIFPAWLITCIITGFSVVIICRILGR